MRRPCGFVSFCLCVQYCLQWVQQYNVLAICQTIQKYCYISIIGFVLWVFAPIQVCVALSAQLRQLWPGHCPSRFPALHRVPLSFQQLLSPIKMTASVCLQQNRTLQLPRNYHVEVFPWHLGCQARASVHKGQFDTKDMCWIPNPPKNVHLNIQIPNVISIPVSPIQGSHRRLSDMSGRGDPFQNCISSSRSVTKYHSVKINNTATCVDIQVNKNIDNLKEYI